jgi:AcrR family transcriptional regulator
LSPRVPVRRQPTTGNGSHYDRKLAEILRQAAAVFCARGYHQASVRDIARATGASLAGLYYYFSSKEHLLYLIQRHAFKSMLESARTALHQLGDPEERLRTFIQLHLQFFLEHPNEMKVLTHEEEWLEAERRHEVHSLKRAYYRLCFSQVEALKKARKLKGLNARLAALSLFGMMNWIYTWHQSGRDPDARECARQMSAIFLHGLYKGGAGDEAFTEVACRKNGARRDRSSKESNLSRSAPFPNVGGGEPGNKPRTSKSEVRATRVF